MGVKMFIFYEGWIYIIIILKTGQSSAPWVLFTPQTGVLMFGVVNSKEIINHIFNRVGSPPTVFPKIKNSRKKKNLTKNTVYEIICGTVPYLKR